MGGHRGNSSNIHLHVVVLQKHFWSDIVRLHNHLVKVIGFAYRAAHSAHDFLAGEVFAEAEIDHFHARGVTLRQKHKVLRFNVSKSGGYDVVGTY